MAVVRTLYALALSSFVILSACAPGDRAPGKEWDGGYDAYGLGGSTPYDYSESCLDGETKRCTIKITLESGTTCFVGQSICVDGTWEDCVEPPQPTGSQSL